MKLIHLYVKEEKMEMFWFIGILYLSAAGISRSSTLITAFLMFELKMTLQNELKLLRSKHPQAYPNSSFLNQLELYEKSLFNKKNKN